MRIGDERNIIKIMHVKFDDQNAGLETMQSDVIARHQHLLHIQKRGVSFTIKNKTPNLYIKKSSFH